MSDCGHEKIILQLVEENKDLQNENRLIRANMNIENYNASVWIKVHAQINPITQKDLRSTRLLYNTCQTVVMKKSSYNYKKK